MKIYIFYFLLVQLSLDECLYIISNLLDMICLPRAWAFIWKTYMIQMSLKNRIGISHKNDPMVKPQVK